MSSPTNRGREVADRIAVRAAQDLQIRPLTSSELGWVEFLRLVSNDADPAPTLERVQALKRILSG